MQNLVIMITDKLYRDLPAKISITHNCIELSSAVKGYPWITKAIYDLYKQVCYKLKI